MSTLYIHIAKGSANRKLTGLPTTDAGNARKDGEVWVVNPVAVADEAPAPSKGRTYDLCPLECIHLPSRFGGTADADCYADGPVLWTADRVDGIPAIDALLVLKEALESGRCSAIRWAVVGDLGRTKAERTLTSAFLTALQSNARRNGVPVIVYSHAWQGLPAPFAGANASCDTIEEVAEARALGWEPVMVAADEPDAARINDALNGRSFVCPEMAGRADGCFAGRTSKSTDRKACGGSRGPLCSRERRSTMVLLAH